MSYDARQPPATTVTQVVSAGLASMAAAFITSRFGVAGTLIGAALTSMIITGGMAILQSHLENVPSKVKARRDQWKARHPAQPATIPGRPDLRTSFMGRMRAAIDRFSHLPLRTRRSILLKGLITAVIAFLICMGAIYAVENVIGNTCRGVLRGSQANKSSGGYGGSSAARP